MIGTSDRLRFVAIDQIDFGVDVLDCLEVTAKLLANIDTGLCASSTSPSSTMWVGCRVHACLSLFYK